MVSQRPSPPWRRLRRRPYGRTSPAQVLSPGCFPPPGLLTALLAAATVVPDTAALRVASRHGSSVLPPWPVSGGASVKPPPARASAPAAAAPDVRWHGASRNYGTRATVPAVAATR